MVVNHNMAAIGQSRQLRYNVKKMEDSSKKLSSGYKIISAMMMQLVYRLLKPCAIRLRG